MPQVASVMGGCPERKGIFLREHKQAKGMVRDYEKVCAVGKAVVCCSSTCGPILMCYRHFDEMACARIVEGLLH